MILKVKNEFAHGGWFIIDNIAEISYEWIKKGQEAGCDRHYDANEALIEDYEVNKEFVQMLITFKDRREEIQHTAVTTFLLNDEGKTIERIY